MKRKTGPLERAAQSLDGTHQGQQAPAADRGQTGKGYIKLLLLLLLLITVFATTDLAPKGQKLEN